MVQTPTFWAAAVVAAMMIGLSKGGLGPLGGLAVPILSFVISPVRAAGLTLPIFMLSDIVAVIAYRRSFDPGLLKVMLPAALVGVGVGWLTAAQVSDDAIRLIVGAVSSLFALDYWFRGRLLAEPLRPSTPRGAFWGALSGYTSFVSHSGGAPFQMYVLPLGLTPAMFAGTATIFFAAVNVMKLAPYYFLGQLQGGELKVAAILVAPAIACALAAVWLVKVIDQKLFYRIVYVLMFVIGLFLIGQAAIDLA